MTHDLPAPTASRRLPTDQRRALLAPLLRGLLAHEQLDHQPLRDLLVTTLTRLSSVVRAQAAFVLVFELASDTLCCVASSVVPAKPHLGPEALVGTDMPCGEGGFLGDPAWRQSPMLLEPVARELPPPLLLERLLGEPVQSLLVAPLSLSREKNGLLVAVNHRDETLFKQPDLDLAVDVAGFVARAIRQSSSIGEPLSEAQRSRYAALLAGCPFKILNALDVADVQLLEEITEQVLTRYQVLPLEIVGPNEVRAAITDPLNWERLNDFEAVTGYRITEKVVTPPSCVALELARLFPKAPRVEAPLEDELTRGLVADLDELTSFSAPGAAVEDVDESSAPIVRLANRLIEEAAAWGASDIHVEAAEHQVVVRYRVDGMLRDRVRLPRATANPLVARLKIMSELDIAEHRLPQDGRIAFDRFSPGVPIDLRVSVMPMMSGECVVLRLLDKRRATLPLDQLGFTPENLRSYRRAIRAPFGMILHCGPTGSGKSMTLYAALNEINDRRRKIVTAEDPIEYTLEGINQLQVRPTIGLTFARALRSFLRHDPDIILVGEIRDVETARIAVEASLTGHLLLSTLHTNDAASSISRLVRLGVEPALVSSTLICVCAQRLLRRVCLECREVYTPSVSELALLMEARPGQDVGPIYQAVGCETCRQAGFKGRVGIHELMLISARLRQRIADGASTDEVAMFARRCGTRTLYQDAVDKVRTGITTMEEALRVTTPTVR